MTQNERLTIHLDAQRPPGPQIEAAIAAVPPRLCEQHPDEVLPLDINETISRALERDKLRFRADCERCAVCPYHRGVGKPEAPRPRTIHGSLDRRKCPLDDEGKPLLRWTGSAELKSELSPQAQYEAWKAAQNPFCWRGKQPLRVREAWMEPPETLQVSGVTVRPPFHRWPRPLYWRR